MVLRPFTVLESLQSSITHVVSLNTCVVGDLIMSILQVRKLRPKECSNKAKEHIPLRPENYPWQSLETLKWQILLRESRHTKVSKTLLTCSHLLGGAGCQSPRGLMQGTLKLSENYLNPRGTESWIAIWLPLNMAMWKLGKGPASAEKSTFQTVQNWESL